MPTIACVDQPMLETDASVKCGTKKPIHTAVPDESVSSRCKAGTSATARPVQPTGRTVSATRNVDSSGVSSPSQQTNGAKFQPITGDTDEGVAARIAAAELTDDRKALERMLTEVGSGNPERRDFALDQIKQLNATQVLPRLKAEADAMEDAQTKIAMLDTIAFLELPSEVFSETVHSTAKSKSPGTSTRQKNGIKTSM